MGTIQNYKIGGFSVNMNCQTPLMLQIMKDYVSEVPAHVDLDLCYTLDQRMQEPWNRMTEEEFEYNYTMNLFARGLVDQGAFCFHASALAVDGEVILISADSGTGKSTHARLWKEYMTEHQIENLNDDKPVIRNREGEYVAYGTPWCGKHRIQKNACAPVKAVVFLKRGKENEIRKISMQDAVTLVLKQVLAEKGNPQGLIKVLDLLDSFLRKIPVYELQCNISEEAVRLVYDTIWEEKENED